MWLISLARALDWPSTKLSAADRLSLSAPTVFFFFFFGDFFFSLDPHVPFVIF
tara:strand:+ start:170 stop:328 length:159 start_codon:yes stop_codon:yes gene_type:complete